MLMLMFSEDIYKSEATKPNQPNENTPRGCGK